MDVDGENRRIVLDNLTDYIDGIAIDPEQQKIFWTNMGHVAGPLQEEFFQADGSIEVADLNGENRKTIVGHGLVVTPKQLTADVGNGHLYWGDREGMRVMRSDLDGSNIVVLIQTGVFPMDARDTLRHCVGVAVDNANNYVYWTQKGPPNGGKGRIFRAGLEIPPGQNSANRTDIELLLDQLPEPIDLEIDANNGFLYWTDRGDLKGGNSLNRAILARNTLEHHEIIAEGLQEGIGLALDHVNARAFTSDLGGNVCVVPLKPGSTFKVIAAQLGVLTGIAYLPS